MTYKEYMKNETGYDVLTTFYEDFAIANHFGKAAIKDTYNRAKKEWSNNYKYLTELVLVLNHHCWSAYNQEKDEISKLYADLFYELQNWCYENFNKKQLEYFFSVTD